MEKSVFKVELVIRPPLSYDVSNKSGGVTIHPEVFEGEKLGELITSLVNQKPEILQRVYDSVNGEILPLVITVINGSIVNRVDALQQELATGDQITWFLTYTGG